MARNEAGRNRIAASARAPVLQRATLLSRPGVARRERGASLRCEQGSPSTELILLSRGAAEVEVLQNGKRLVVARLAPGSSELGVLTRTPRSATVRASEAGTEVVAFPAERLDALLQDSRVATGLLRTVSQRLAQTLAQLSSR